jgi:hypothetical protein
MQANKSAASYQPPPFLVMIEGFPRAEEFYPGEMLSALESCTPSHIDMPSWGRPACAVSWNFSINPILLYIFIKMS